MFWSTSKPRLVLLLVGLGGTTLGSLQGSGLLVYLSPPLSWGLRQFPSHTCTSTLETLEVPKLTSCPGC